MRKEKARAADVRRPRKPAQQLGILGMIKTLLQGNDFFVSKDHLGLHYKKELEAGKNRYRGID